MTARSVRCRILWLALAVLSGCRHAAPPNVVVVLVDTLRPDRLGIYGSPRGLTPSIDAFAAQATVFRNAYAQSSWTLPSVASLFTSRFQSQHHVVSFRSTLDGREETLAEILHARGYATAAFLANIMIQERQGFAQGFDLWRYVFRSNATAGEQFRLKTRGADVNRALFEWIDGRTDPAKPVMLYVHYFDPHVPYDPPDDIVAARFGGAPAPDRAAVNRYGLSARIPLPDALLPDAVALYDAEVASSDAAIGELLAGLRRRHVLDDALVVLLADHGEEFKEHGLFGHGETLYEEVIRVPMLIASTSRPAHNEVDEPVAVIDVAPTILALLGEPIPPQFEGISRAPDVGAQPWWAVFRSSQPKRRGRPIISELISRPGRARLSPHERAVVSNGTKLIAGVDGQRSFYDLQADPGERDPSGVALGQRAALEDGLAWMQAFAASAIPTPALALDDETRERLRALGYSE